MGESRDTTETPEASKDRRAEQHHAHARTTSLAAIVEHLPHPILLLVPGDPMRIWYANEAAYRQLAGACALRIEHDVLRVEGPLAVSFLRTLRDVHARGPNNAETAQFALGADSNFLASIFVDVLELGSDVDAPRTRLLLLEIPEHVSPEQALQRMRAEFDLTQREAEIVLELHAHGSATELARHQRRSIHTVRAQIKSAMDKTNTKTQASLVALVGSRLTG